MDLQTEKCVMVIREDLPAGVAANTAGILGMTLGKLLPQTVGPDVEDREGRRHLGISAVPVPVLRADGETLRRLRERLFEPEFSAVVAVDFTGAAQGCRTYNEWQEKSAALEPEAADYLGLGLWGGKKLVNRLTGSLPLLR